jgi:hypothetical protein
MTTELDLYAKHIVNLDLPEIRCADCNTKIHVHPHAKPLEPTTDGSFIVEPNLEVVYMGCYLKRHQELKHEKPPTQPL